jgi:hypothetical protein
MERPDAQFHGGRGERFMDQMDCNPKDPFSGGDHEGTSQGRFHQGGVHQVKDQESEVVPNLMIVEETESGALNQSTNIDYGKKEVQEGEGNEMAGHKDESSYTASVTNEIDHMLIADEDEWQLRARLKGKEIMGVEDVKVGEKSYVPLVCHKCKGTGHMARDCRSNWQAERGTKQHVDHGVGGKKNLCDLVAPLCAIQVEGRSFFCILD